MRPITRLTDSQEIPILSRARWGIRWEYTVGGFIPKRIGFQGQNREEPMGQPNPRSWLAAGCNFVPKTVHYRRRIFLQRRNESANPITEEQMTMQGIGHPLEDKRKVFRCSNQQKTHL